MVADVAADVPVSPYRWRYVRRPLSTRQAGVGRSRTYRNVRMAGRISLGERWPPHWALYAYRHLVTNPPVVLLVRLPVSSWSIKI